MRLLSRAMPTSASESRPAEGLPATTHPKSDSSSAQNAVLFENLFPCPFEGCIASFETAGRLRKHSMTHERKATFTCEHEECAKSFRTKAHWQRHMQTPHGTAVRAKKEYICSFCVKKCKTRFDLKVHEAVHTGKKPLKCDTCDATFAKNSRLKQHLKTHHMYSCAFAGCDFEADKWSLLRKHLPVHNVKCSLCSAKFKSQATLQRHLLSHQTLFACSQCDLKYGKKSNLTAHVKTVHEKMTFKCPVTECGKEFCFKKSLRHHIKSHSEQTERRNPDLSITMRRVATAAVLSGYVAGDDETRAILAEDKAFRIEKSKGEENQLNFPISAMTT